MRVASSTRFVAIALLCVVVGGAVGSTAPVAASPVARGQVAVGDVVVADQEAGEVLRLRADGASEVLLEGLGAVRGVAVLSDGAVVAADSEAGTLVAVGGRFGEDPIELATGLESPEALAVAGRGRVYVTSFSEGTLSTVDVDTGAVRSVAAGLDGPSAVVPLRAPRGENQVAVAEWFGGDVAAIRRSGASAPGVASGFARPAGLATDGDGTVYVADLERGRVVAVDRDGAKRTVVEVDAPAGLALDPVAPAPGQDADLVVASADGVLRIALATGARDVLADVDTAVGVSVAPDEIIAAPAVGADGEAEAAPPGAAGGDQALVQQSDGNDLDPVMVVLVALAVFLGGVALVSGIQLVRSRGDEDDDPERYAGMTRKERRRAQGTDRAVRAAERKTDKEIAKAEKRAAKLAPPDATPEPEPEPEPVALPVVDPAALFRDDPAVAAAPVVAGLPAEVPAEVVPGTRAAKREADRQAKLDAKAAKAQAKADAEQARRDEQAAKAQAKLDARAAADADKAAKAQAKQEAKAAAAAAKAAKKGRGGAPPPVDEAVAPAIAPEAEVPAAPVAEPAPGEVATSEGRVPLFAAPATAPTTPGPFLESLFVDDPVAEPADVVEPVGSVEAPPAGAVASSAASPETPVAAEAPAPEPVAEEPVRPEPIPIIDFSPVPEPRPPVPDVPAAPLPAVATPVALEPADEADRAPEPFPDLTEAVARSAPPRRGLIGRRKAKRRQRAAEHRHRQLRALNAIVDVPAPAPPPLPVRPALDVAPAASIAFPEAVATPKALRAPRPELAAEPGPAPWAEPAVDEPAAATPVEPTVEKAAPAVEPTPVPTATDPWAGMPPLSGVDDPSSAGVAVPWPGEPTTAADQPVPRWPDEPPP